MKLGLMLSVLSSSAVAQDVSCVLEDGTPLRFSIDRRQFAPPVDAKDPPRRKVTDVQVAGQHFGAEPFLIGDMRGFHGQDNAGATIMFVARADGTARYANTTTGTARTGLCEVQ